MRFCFGPVKGLALRFGLIHLAFAFRLPLPSFYPQLLFFFAAVELYAPFVTSA